MKLCVRLTVEVSRQTPDSTTTSSPRLSDPAPTTNDTPLGSPSLQNATGHERTLSGIGVSLAKIMATLTRMERRERLRDSQDSTIGAGYFKTLWKD